MLLSWQPDVLFLELALLGIGVSRTALLEEKGNWEGAVMRVAFSDLEQKLIGNELWVPLGKAHVLAWLALGAPISDAKPARFNGKSGQDLFRRIVG